MKLELDWLVIDEAIAERDALVSMLESSDVLVFGPLLACVLDCIPRLPEDGADRFPEDELGPTLERDDVDCNDEPLPVSEDPLKFEVLDETIESALEAALLETGLGLDKLELGDEDAD